MHWQHVRPGLYELRKNGMLCGDVRVCRGRYEAYACLGDGKNLGSFEYATDAMDAVATAISEVTGWTWTPDASTRATGKQ